MNKNNISLEARKALNEYRMEIAEELNANDTHLYDLRSNLSTSDSVTPPLVETEKKSRSNPNNSLSDFLGKSF